MVALHCKLSLMIFLAESHYSCWINDPTLLIVVLLVPLAFALVINFGIFFIVVRALRHAAVQQFTRSNSGTCRHCLTNPYMPDQPLN